MKWVSGHACSNTAHSVLILDCRYLLNLIPRQTIKHCFREAKHCVDKLARKGVGQQWDFIVFNDPPEDLTMLLYSNAIDTFFERPHLVLV